MAEMNVVQVIPDRFQSAESAKADKTGTGASASKPFIRRPTRGIELREDTFATLRVVTGSGKNLLLVDAGSRRSDGNSQLLEINGKRATDIYSNFLLQTVQEDRQEKQQILETFGEAFIFLFGERPRIMNFTGILVNTFDFNWEAEWWHNYDNYIRGTRCVENDARVYLSFDNTLVSGYIIGASATKNAQERNWVNMQFQMFITSYSSFSDVGNPYSQPGFDYNGGQVFESNAFLTDAEMATFRPTLLPDFGKFPVSNFGFELTGNGQVKMPKLEQGLLQQLSVVTQAWTSTRNVVNNAAAAVSGLLNGDHVRVPVGFAGSMAFDQDDLLGKVTINGIKSGQPLLYSVFSDNEDEYVGVSDHYGSSKVNSDFTSKFLKNLGYTDQALEINYGQELVQAATELWGNSEFGVTIPGTQLGPLSSFLVGKGVGLMGVAATKAITAASGGINAAGSAVARFASSLPNPITVISE